MNVALCTPTYWPEVRRGGERLAHDLAAHTGARIVTSHRGPTRRDPDAIRLRRLPGSERLRRRGYEDHLTHLPLLVRELRRGPYDLAHALHHADASAALRAGLLTVWTFLGIPHRTGLANRRKRLELVQRARHADATLVLSDAAARAYRRWLGGDPIVIHPGVDLDAFTPGGERAEEFTVLCPAALDAPFKRPELLLEAFAHVRGQRPGARLIVQEGGPTGEGIEHRNLDRHEDLLAAYREAHVTALASRGEAFGLVLVESLACGTPAVGSDDAGAAEITPLTFHESPLDLATKILDAASLDPATCREHAQQFDIRRCAAQHLDLYKEVLASRQR